MSIPDCSWLIAERSGTSRLRTRGGRLWRRWSCALVIAFFVRTRDHRAGLQILLHQVLTAAARTFFWNWLVRGSELALRIIAASVERVALTRALFDQLSVFALGAL